MKLPMILLSKRHLRPVTLFLKGQGSNAPVTSRSPESPLLMHFEKHIAHKIFQKAFVRTVISARTFKVVGKGGLKMVQM